MDGARVAKKDKNQRIQVFVRVRPINNSEISKKSTSIVTVPTDYEVIVQERPQDRHLKKFTFDKVFGTLSKQIDVYNAVVSPMLDEVLAGYNCTVFAYGQTGTGKTFTMEGVSKDPAAHWHSDTTAGMIPRAVSHLFEELRLLEIQEYTVRVSFLELYNEEVFDLLSASDDASKIRLYEDAARKGGVIISGLEEITVCSTSEVYKILEKGSEKRRTAPTQMNARSSRSHTVFSVTVHMKENTVNEEELLKTGKLNLVDLAGSENVGRSGAVDRRAREAGSINQSLLTLGRVITALVEKTPHIPYRESKLTRLLQESLGGRTKTSIIATVSPASINLEETLSTLDYAYRARNITNRPEVNQKLSKKILLKEYTEEIERLRRDLLANRERNGVYLAYDMYNEMQTSMSSRNKEIEEKINNIKTFEETVQSKEKVIDELQMKILTQTNELNAIKNQLNAVTHTLKSSNHRLKIITRDRDEQKYLVEKHVLTEKIQLSEAETLLSVVDTATVDTYKLHEKISRKTQVEEKNEVLGQELRSNMTQRIQDIENNIFEHTCKLKQLNAFIKNQIVTEITAHSDNIDTAIRQISMGLTNQHLTAIDNLLRLIDKTYANYQAWIQNNVKCATDITETESQFLTNTFTTMSAEFLRLIGNESSKILQNLNGNVSEKLWYISTYVKETVNSISDYHLKEYDCLWKSVQEAKDNLNNNLRNKSMIEKRRALAKMMENLTAQFNLLNEEEEKVHTFTTEQFDNVNEICDRVQNHVSDHCCKNIDMQKHLETKIENDLEEILSGVANKTDENVQLARVTMEQAKVLTNELQCNISRSCDALIQYKSGAESDAKDMYLEIDGHKTEILAAINDIHKTVVDASVCHTKSMEEQKAMDSNICPEICSKLENHDRELTDRSNGIIEQLRTTQHQIDKFFVEDMARDVPTGTTPVKKDFSYPRQFTVTSPHERILQRYREVRKVVETSADDGDSFMNGDITMVPTANSTALNDVTVISSVDDKESTISASDNRLPPKHLDSCNSVDNPIENGTANRLSVIPKLSKPVRQRSDLCLCTKNGDVNNGTYDNVTLSSGDKPTQKRWNSFNSLDNHIDNVAKTTLSSIPKPSKPAPIRPELNIYVKHKNKENRIYESLKSDKTKDMQQLRMKRQKRQVLGAYN